MMKSNPQVQLERDAIEFGNAVTALRGAEIRRDKLTPGPKRDRAEDLLGRALVRVTDARLALQAAATQFEESRRKRP